MRRGGKSIWEAALAFVVFKGFLGAEKALFGLVKGAV